MRYIRELSGALILFGIIIGLFVMVNNGIQSNYNIPDTTYELSDGTTTTDTIGDKLNNLNIIQGLDDLKEAFQKIKLGNMVDILGGLATGGIGLLLTLLGMVTFPFEIANIISNYYNLPPIFLNGILALMISYVAYIIISAYTRGDL